MFTRVFKYWEYIQQFRNGVRDPEALAREISLAPLQFYFFVTSLVLWLLILGSFWAGVIEGITFFQFTLVFFLLCFMAVLVLYLTIRKILLRIIKLGSKIVHQESDRAFRYVQDKTKGTIIDINPK